VTSFIDFIVRIMFKVILKISSKYFNLLSLNLSQDRERWQALLQILIMSLVLHDLQMCLPGRARINDFKGLNYPQS
jgi:hypothetical protein